MLLRYASLPALLLALAPAAAQIAFGGAPFSQSGHHLPAPPVHVMPPVDAEALMAEDEARAAQGIKGPYRFGFNHHPSISTAQHGVWTTLPNGDAVWRVAIECPGAYSINFEFNDYVVPEGGQVFVYNETGDVLGALTAESNPGHQELGVTMLPGDRITIEYLEPFAVRGQGFLRIGQVTHAYRDVLGLTKGFGDSGSCNVNVICPAGNGWQNQIRSVAMIVSGGSGICTGQLINNCSQNGTPYFLTANHCITGSNVGTWLFRFNWNSPTCTPTQNAPTNNVVSGSQLRANSAGSDVALLQLNSTPPASYNVYYTGWDKSGTAPTASTCIHHPSGDIKKISHDTNPATAVNWSGAACWRIANWETGTTEPGSSGSGLWNQNGLLIGQLYGGQASCSNNVNDYFGRFSVSYPILQTWLGDCGNTLPGWSPLTTAVEEAAAPAELALVPNPSQGQVTVVLPPAMRAEGRLAVHDALGKLVMARNTAAGLERITIDLAGEPEGVYFVEALADGYRAVQRLVITR